MYYSLLGPILITSTCDRLASQQEHLNLIFFPQTELVTFRLDSFSSPTHSHFWDNHQEFREATSHLKRNNSFQMASFLPSVRHNQPELFRWKDTAFLLKSWKFSKWTAVGSSLFILFRLYFLNISEDQWNTARTCHTWHLLPNRRTISPPAFPSPSPVRG